MKKIILPILLLLIGYRTAFCQPIVIDRSKLVPVTVNSIFFTAYYSVTNMENKKVSFSDVGLGLGQIFTYKGSKRELEDLQSLTLVEAYIFDERSGQYIKYN